MAAAYAFFAGLNSAERNLALSVNVQEYFKGFTLKNPDEGSALDPQAFEKA